MNITNLNKSGKSRGILAFALNTDKTDYEKIANLTVQLASQILNLPYTLITDVDDSAFTNSRFDIDHNEFVTWRNFNRSTVYDLTPYEETLVIDVDYLILDKQILKIFETDWDYILQRNSHTLEESWPRLMGEHSHPYIWATVFAFRKTSKAEKFFKLVDRIQKNYFYYRLLFNISERIYRNDYAFAIADIILNGYTIETKTIPGSMLALNQSIQSLQLLEGKIFVKQQNKGYVLPVTNCHVMSKKYLQTKNFENFCAEAVRELA
jgi:hypothetical protein